MKNIKLYDVNGRHSGQFFTKIAGTPYVVLVATANKQGLFIKKQLPMLRRFKKEYESQQFKLNNKKPDVMIFDDIIPEENKNAEEVNKS